VDAVLVLGGSGFVGSRVRELWDGPLELLAPTHAELDVLDWSALASAIQTSPASSVLNLVAWADVDGAEAQSGDESGRVYQLNASLPGRLAELCRAHGKHLLHVSTDYVFDGVSHARPYRETDPTRALCWYAETKLAGEAAVLDVGGNVTVARIEMPFSGRAFPKRDFARAFLARLESSSPFKAVVDQRITPVFLDDAIEAFRLLLAKRTPGVMHVAAADATTPFAFAQALARRMELDVDLVEQVSFEEFAATRSARRPQHSWLDVTRFGTTVQPGVLRSVEDELDAWAAQMLATASRA
jgi:dTDP-4-dehydrorhamnose reductase